MKVCFMGLGYIGLPTAIIVAGCDGVDVLGVDINSEYVEMINRGILYIFEPDLQDLCEGVVQEGKLHAAMSPEVSDVYIIVVPTPFKGNHEPDISYVREATRTLLPLLKPNDLYIIESTCPVGTTEKMSDFIYENRPDLQASLFIAYCPERVLPGNIVYELIHNDRVIGGVNESSTLKALQFYQLFVQGNLYRTDAKTAEMCKLVENSSRDVQIAFANELSLICDKAGVNVLELINLANKHPRVNILRPGCGVGGHCIAVDPYFLTADFPLESQLIKKAREINNYKTLWCAERVQNAIIGYELECHRKPVVAMMGLAFKPNIDDLREAPAKYITTKVMQSCTNVDLLIVEPNIKVHTIFKLTHYQEAYEKADIVVFLVAHNEFKCLVKQTKKIILDFCGVFE